MRWILWVIFLVMFPSPVVFSGELPCPTEQFERWEITETGDIGQLFRDDPPETRECIRNFFREISCFSREHQDALISARLVGVKTINNIQTTLAIGPGKDGHFEFHDGLATYRFAPVNPRYEEWAYAHKELRRLKRCMATGLRFSVSGVVIDVEVHRTNGSLNGVTIRMEDARMHDIETLYAKGPISEQVKPLQKKLQVEYDRLMTIGMETARDDTRRDVEGPFRKVTPPDTCRRMTFVRIPPGEFIMGGCGRANERPLRRVRISHPFYIGSHEVTQAQWREVMGSDPSCFRPCDDCPVENVSWWEVQKFLLKLNQRASGLYRLPTEAEWECAARAGASSAFCYGETESGLTEYAWYSQNSAGRPQPVRGKWPNCWGLFDMHGNVWEWCQDRYGAYSGFSARDPKGPDQGKMRVIRGGGRGSYGRDCRSASRDGRNPKNGYSSVGFRVVYMPDRG